MKKDEPKEGDEKTSEKPKMKLSRKYIRLVSRDEKSFYINKQIACVSEHIKEVLASGFLEGSANTIHLDIESLVLEKCIEYLHYKFIQ